MLLIHHVAVEHIHASTELVEALVQALRVEPLGNEVEDVLQVESFNLEAILTIIKSSWSALGGMLQRFISSCIARTYSNRSKWSDLESEHNSIAIDIPPPDEAKFIANEVLTQVITVIAVKECSQI